MGATSVLPNNLHVSSVTSAGNEGCSRVLKPAEWSVDGDSSNPLQASARFPRTGRACYRGAAESLPQKTAGWHGPVGPPQPAVTGKNSWSACGALADSIRVRTEHRGFVISNVNADVAPTGATAEISVNYSTADINPFSDDTESKIDAITPQYLP